MRVLYLGVYRDGTGWGNSAIDYMMALDAAGLDVVARPIKLNKRKIDLPEKIKLFESKASSKPDVVIQNILPHMMDYHGKIKQNIALYTTETSNFNSSSWPGKINTMDSAWVMNKQSKSASIDSGVSVPISIVPVPTDVSQFCKSYEKLNFTENLNNDFIFYTICELNTRKNLPALIRAFHSEFEPDEPVQLVIKTTPLGFNTHDQLVKLCNDIKTNLKLYPKLFSYKKEILITDYWSHENIMRLHKTADCFVSTSHGEAWCIPAFEAMGFGNNPIVPDCTAFQDYIDEDVGYLVPADQTPVYGMTETFPELFTGREDWWDIRIRDLQKAMRQAYEDKETYQKKRMVGMQRIHNFSYNKVGEAMKGILEHKHDE